MAATKRATVRAGHLFKQRREELGLTQSDVVAQGGPSAMTLRGIENGTAGHEPRPWTIAALEQVLGLPRGTYDSVVAGGDLPALHDVDPADRLRREARRLMSQADRADRSDDVVSVRSLRLPDDLWEKAVEAADTDGVPVSQLIREALRDYLEQHL